MSQQSVPSARVVNLLQQYNDLMEADGPQSEKAKAFFDANENDEVFRAHALPLFYEHMEDFKAAELPKGRSAFCF